MIRHMFTIIFSIRLWLRMTFTLIYLSIVADLSLLPSNDLPELPLFPGADKIIHSCMYLGLTWLTCWSFQAESKRNQYYYIFLFSVSWGAIMELLQLFMHQGRSFELLDIFSNLVGTFAGLLFYIFMARYKEKPEIKRADNNLH